MVHALCLMIGAILGTTICATIMLVILEKVYDYAYKAGKTDGFVDAFNQGRDYEYAIGRYEDDGK